MSDVIATRYLLANNAPLIARVPAAKIAAGAIPIGTVLPAVAINHIDTIERLSVDMAGTKIMATARVQVTVQAKTYIDQKQILELVRRALPNTRGTVNGVEVDSILPDGSGPDLRDDDAGIYMQSRDFIVKFLELR